MSECFHCGLTVPAGTGWTLEVLEQERHFCCPGCLAVCRTIVDAGLADYYRHRQQPSARAQQSAAELLRELALYDRPEIQSSFVRSKGASREAALILENIRCPACLWLNEQHLRSIDGMLDVDIDYNSDRARVVWDPERLRLSEILQAISEIGYIAHPYDPAHRDELIRLQRRRSSERMIFAGAVGMAVMQFSIGTYLLGAPGPDGMLPLWVVLGRWSALLATTALLVYSAQEFFLGAWNDWKRRRLGMDVPIVLGLSVAFLGSVVATIQQHGEVYFDSIAMFVFFLLIARRFELKGRIEAAKTLDRLARVVPRMAHRLTDDGGLEEVAVVDLKPGERIRVRAGEAVPVDGVLEEGAGSFDESVLTGEALPVHRATGGSVSAGSRNLEHPIVLRVSRCEAESTVSELEGLLREGMRSRPRSALLAEQAAAVFVPVILLLAAVTAGVWLWLDPGVALENTVALLIVTCPCALALATPVAVSIGVSRFASIGVLPLRMEALEGLCKADTVVFDKTGTLTQGRLRIDEIHPVDGFDRSTALEIAAALERDSEHPLALAFREAAPAGPIQVDERRIEGGRGVSGRIDGAVWRLGQPGYASDGGPLSDALTASVDRLEAAGRSVVVLSRDARPVALFGLRDQPRPGLPETLRALRRQGIERLLILSGDNQGAVDVLAGGLDVDAALGGCLPQQKMARVRELQARGHRVAMVGDGINDAATLAAADVSISFAEANELAQASSDFLVLGDSLEGVARARALARRTRRTILQNLSWAVGYNALAVPAAMLGLIAPWGAAIGMSASSLLVVANSLRLRRDPKRRRAAAQVANPGARGLAETG